MTKISHSSLRVFFSSALFLGLVAMSAAFGPAQTAQAESEPTIGTYCMIHPKSPKCVLVAHCKKHPDDKRCKELIDKIEACLGGPRKDGCVPPMPMKR